MAADPIRALRNVADREKNASEVRTLVARGLIDDLVAQLARVMANRVATGPEEVRLKDLLLHEVLNYAKAIQDGPTSLDYMIAYTSPVETAKKIEQQSLGLAELEKDIVEAVQQDLSGTVPFTLPKTRDTE